MRGLLSPSRVHSWSISVHVCCTKGTYLFSLIVSLSLLHLFLPTYFPCLCTHPSLPFPLTVNLATSPPLPLPRRARSAVLTLGFVQICSLRGWKVVMRAKKNSLALRLTTRRVFQMKPNENSIFCPCYSPPSHPPSLYAPILAPLMCRLISHSCRRLFNTLARPVKVLQRCKRVSKIRPVLELKTKIIASMDLFLNFPSTCSL